MMGYKETTCQYLTATDIMEAYDEVIGHSNGPRYHYYCKKKRKEIAYPNVCMRHCEEYEPN